jgi:2-hydroxymuconate-semialdehyde hydrolase
MDGVKIHCYEGGSGYPILLIHGSGPGTASASNWAHVLEPLSKRYRVLAMDLIGYGLSGRKPRQPYFDLPMWVRQAQFVLDHLAPRGPVGVIGHSLGGYLTLRLAANEPRIDKILVQGSLGKPMKNNPALHQGWSFPRNEAEFRSLYTVLLRGPTSLTSEFVRNRLALIAKDGYDDYFTKMFQGDKQRYLDKAVLTRAELKRITCKVHILHGANDAAVPFHEACLPLADALPQAHLTRLANCGHPCSFDQPESFLHVANAFFGDPSKDRETGAQRGRDRESRHPRTVALQG